MSEPEIAKRIEVTGCKIIGSKAVLIVITAEDGKQVFWPLPSPAMVAEWCEGMLGVAAGVWPESNDGNECVECSRKAVRGKIRCKFHDR